MRFDAIPTASNPPARQQAAPMQAYPGDSRRAEYLDNTYTGSVNRAAVQPVTAEKPRFWQRGIFAGSTNRAAPQPASASRQPFWQRAFRAPVPPANVGQGTVAATRAQPLPATQSYPVAAQQLPPPQTYPGAQAHPGAAQPFPGSPSGAVARAPAPDPFPQTMAGNSQNAPLAPAMVDPVPTGSISGGGSVQGNVVTARSGDTLRKVADRYSVPVDRLARANGLAANAALAPGQQIVIPSFGNDAAAAKLPPPTNNAPLPAPAPAERVAVLPQQTRPAERQQSGSDTVAAGSVYTVKSGDTLSAIAKRHGTTAASIRAANGMDSGIIRVGQKLVVPGAGGAKSAAAKLPAGVDPVVTGSTPRSNQVSGYTPPKPAEMAVEEAAGQAGTAPDATGIGLMRWPVRGRVVAGFGDTSGPKRNDGLDIAVPEGTSVKAAENGVVIYAGDGLKDFGRTVLVRHENGLVTVYGHTSEIKVSRGDTVRRGQEIALSGVSGNATSPKLHFEVRKDSVPVNPATFLE